MRKQLVTVVVVCQALLLVALGGMSAAQSLKDVPPQGSPGAVERSLQPRELPSPVRLPEITIEDETLKKLKGGEGVTFDLTGISFEGNRVFSSQDLSEVVAANLGKTIEVKDLQVIADAVTAYYKKNGYFLSRAYIPPQTIKQGSVLIKIREGRLGEIYIKGNKRYSRKLIRNTLKIIRGEGAIQTSDVERGLLLLSDIPGLKVKATFKPGSQPGASDIVLDVMEDRQFTGEVHANTFGSDYVSRYRFGAGVNATNITTLGDMLSVTGMTGDKGVDDLLYTRAEFMLPLGYSGTRLGVHYRFLDYGLGEELEPLESKGTSHVAGLWISYPIMRGRSFSWWVQGGLDAKTVTQEILGQEVGEDILRIGHLGTSFQILDRYQGSTFVNLTGYQNFPSIMGGMEEAYNDTLRQNTEVSFSKATISVTRLQRIASGLMGFINVVGELSGDRVPMSEQLSIGGAGTVRGYDQSEYNADKGYYGTLELRASIPGTESLQWGGDKGKTVWETLQLAGFVDYGKVYINDPLPSETMQDDRELVGAGLGIRFNYLPWVRLKVDWAKSIGGEDPQDKDVRDNGTWYAQVDIRF